MADKLTQQMIDGLGRAAAECRPMALIAAKSEPGLFAATAKLAAQKCVSEGYLEVANSDHHGKGSRELFTLTATGWEFLLASVNPRQVLEDFVRVLESRQQEIGQLLQTAQQMAESLSGLQESVARVLPRITSTRVSLPERFKVEESDDFFVHSSEDFSIDSRRNGNCPLPNAAVLESPKVALEQLCRSIVGELAAWRESAAVGEDCSLSELYRRVSREEFAVTIGAFHDCLRKLHADGAIYLHPWTGPLYALPEPGYALLAGHNVAYYSSLPPMMRDRPASEGIE